MNKMIRSAVLCGLALAVSAPVAATELEKRPYLSGLYQLSFQDENRGSDRGHGIALTVGKALNDYWGIELGGFGGDYNPRGLGSGWNEYGFHVDGLFFYDRARQFAPYFVMGAGVATNWQQIGNESDDSPMVHAGLGFFKQLGDHLGYRADLRYRWIDNNNLSAGDFSEPVLRVGLTWALGPRPAQAPVRPASFDSDGDGVLEDVDRCPGTPKGVAVDVYGCPDSDGDGIGDASDECPDSPAGARVDARGCSLDTDGDGVFDYADKCPNTAAGVKVDADGCPVAGTVIRKFEDINFAFDKATLTDYARITLDNTAKVIREMTREYPTLRVQVDGHTDSTGPAEYNLRLGQRRANAVRDYLVVKGVEAERIRTRSFGESQPIASNATPKGRLLNRRAEIRAVIGGSD